MLACLLSTIRIELYMYLTQLSDIYTILEIVVLAELLCPISHVYTVFGFGPVWVLEMYADV